MTPREWRTEQKKKQEEIASLLGCKQSYVSRIENGKAPSLRVAYKYHEISNGLVSIADFPEVQS